jgi:hypothetical protein
VPLPDKIVFKGKEMKTVKKNVAILVLVFTFTLLIGCNQIEKKLPTYKAIGDIDTVEISGGVVEGIKSIYSVRLINLQPGSNPASDVSSISFGITKHTTIYQNANGKKSKADISAVEKGKRVEMIWRFANDHFTEAVELYIK